MRFNYLKFQNEFNSFWNFSMPRIFLQLLDFLGSSYWVRQHLRPTLLRLVGFQIGPGCQIKKGLVIIGSGKKFDIRKALSLGECCVIGSNVKININISEVSSGLSDICPIIIEDYAWVDDNVTILQGTKIQTGSVIESGTILVKKTPSHCVIGGRPARLKIKCLSTGK